MFNHPSILPSIRPSFLPSILLSILQPSQQTLANAATNSLPFIMSSPIRVYSVGVLADIGKGWGWVARRCWLGRVLGAGCWVLDWVARCWVPGRVLGAGCWVGWPGAGCCLLGAGLGGPVLGAGCWVLALKFNFKINLAFDSTFL